MKQCSKCKENRALSLYHVDNSRRDGLHSICKLCHKEYSARARLDSTRVARLREVSRKWRADNPDKAKAGIRCATLRKKYGITAAQYDLIFTLQDNKCAICRGTDSRGNGRMHVDHDHSTGKIRGILCQACNVTLGKMHDSPSLLRAAALYLEKHH